MNLEIRDMCPDDAEGKGYVHYASWFKMTSKLERSRLYELPPPPVCELVAPPS